MPPLPVVPNVTKIEYSGTYHDAKWVNLYYVRFSGTSPSVTDMTGYVTDVATQLNIGYTAEMSVDNEATGIIGTDLTTDTGARGSYDFSAFGARSGDFMPAGVAMVGSLEISRRYRGGHPRKYLPWGTAGTMASGSTIDWDSGFVADCQLKFTTLLNAIVGITYGGTTWDQVCNVSYYSGNALRAIPLVDNVASGQIRTRICSQRRRLGKVGG